MVGVLTSIVLSVVWMFYLGQPPLHLVHHYRICTLAFATSTLIELSAEPLRLFGQSFSFIRLKVFTEGVLVTTRCVVSVTLVILFPGQSNESIFLSQFETKFGLFGRDLWSFNFSPVTTVNIQT